jgi:PKD repeat protein
MPWADNRSNAPLKEGDFMMIKCVSLTRLALSMILGTLLAVPALAQIAKQGGDVLSSLSFVHEELRLTEESEPLDDVRAVVDKSLQNGWEAFRIGAGPDTDWNASIDKRTGLVTFAEGGNVAWIPGHGNQLTTRDIAGFLKARPRIDLEVLDAIARDYMPRVESFMGFDPGQLTLNRGRSGQPASHLWFVDYDVVREGMPIEGARVVFRVNNGNLIQAGTENLPAPGATVPPAKLTQKAALAAVANFIGGFQAGDSFRDKGSLHLLPVSIASARSAEGYELGKGRGIAKVWQFVFHRDGVMGTWRARVDAATGEVLELTDINDYVSAQVTGGTYLNSPATGGEVVRPAPYADVSSGGFTNSAGIYNWTSGTVSSALAGQYVRITDTCGAISQASDASGNIAFGTSTGTDCTTPGHGGAGNTHSSREQFYQVNRIKEVVRGWLPGNAWINTQLTVNVDLNRTCNAYWNGSTLNFFKSGGGCNNTGEIAGVSLHEFGHGIDQNDGTGTATDGATGESYGDTTALIALHNSCLGAGFLSGNCTGYGDACTSCTGVRDADYAKHSSNTPATANNFIRVRCPAPSGGAGPCGREVHCESYVPTETMWDVANRDLPNPGTGPAWTTLDRLWYLSRNTATKSFSCTAGSTYTSNGCGAGSLWKVFRAVDDDDGNLANGTPHGGALFAAFNRHGIACTTDTGASTTFAGCTPPASPTLTVTAGASSAALSWTSSGAAVYDVFRNETGCNAGFTKIATGAATTSLTDTAVANGLTYYYQVTAFPSGNESCASAPSVCRSVSPTADQPPTARFTFTCTGRICSFDGSTSTDDAGISSYAWSFGDGGTATGVTPTHTYTADGTFTVTLTVSDTTGQTNQTSQAVTVAVTVADYPPFASFYVGCTNFTCNADSEGSGDDNGIVNYTWTWGDGSTTTGGSPVSAPSHTYAAAGTYTITLTVSDIAGQTSTTSHAVTVSLGPTAAFTFHCTGSTCNFDASDSTSTVAITNYHWDWDDESVTDTASATTQHVYAYGSSFGVTLTITDANGAFASVTHTVSVP